jgi:hypothetical protein
MQISVEKCASFLSWEAIVVTSMTNKADDKKKLQMEI